MVGMASENHFLSRISILSPGRRMLAAITGINLIVFLGCLLSGFGQWKGWWSFDILNVLGMSGDAGMLIRRAWTPMTYMFTQRDFLHILFNMLWLWWFGDLLTATQSCRRIFAIYLAAGLSGALVFFLATLTGFFNSSLLIGSSASVLGMMAAAAVISPDTEFRFFLLGSVKLKYIAIVCAALAFIGIGGGNAGGESAHLGGLLFGLLYGLYWRGFFNRRRGPILGKKFDSKLIKSLSRPTVSEYARLDELLDKIRLSGFDSLSSKERNELSFLSRKLKIDN